MSNAAVSEYKAATISRDAFIKNAKQPIVFFFQPTEFAILKDPADLRLWERDMKARVGLSGPHSYDASTESCTESGCTNDCDSD